MPADEAPRARTVLCHVTGGLAAVLLAVVAAPTTASATDTRPWNSHRQAELVQAERECTARHAGRDGGAAVRCAGDLASPDPPPGVEVDLFRLFSDCLYIASQQVADQMYPPTDDDYEDYVNDCLGL
jgi:hypothetical protein